MLYDKITEIFVKVDDFCNEFKNEFSKALSKQLSQGFKCRSRAASLCDSEVITLLSSFQIGQIRNFKHFYTIYANVHLKNEFTGLVSSKRFIKLSHRHALAFMLFI